MKIEKKYTVQSEKLEETVKRFNYQELRKFQKRESYHKKVINSQKEEIKKIKVDNEQIKKLEKEKQKTNKSLNYYKKQNTELKERQTECKQLTLNLQKQLQERNKDINCLIDQVNDLLDDKISIDTVCEGKYLPVVRQVVQDLHSFGVGVKHIGQTIQSVLKHFLGIENIKLPSESSNRRMVLESNLIAKMQIAERMLESQNPNTLHFDGTTDAQNHYLGFQVSTSDGSLSLSMSENFCGDTKSQLDTSKKIFSELSDLISNSDDEIEKNYAHLLISIKI